MEKNMENEMETGGYWGLNGLNMSRLGVLDKRVLGELARAFCSQTSKLAHFGMMV